MQRYLHETEPKNTITTNSIMVTWGGEDAVLLYIFWQKWYYFDDSELEAFVFGGRRFFAFVLV